MSKVCAFVGLSYCGKTTAREITQELLTQSGHDWHHVYYGGVVLDEVATRDSDGLWTAEQAGLTQQQKERHVREELRKEHGLGIMALRCMPEVTESKNSGKIVLIDDLYSDEERIALQGALGPEELLIVALVADWNVRVQRALSRPHRPLASADELRARDEAELDNLNKAKPIAVADLTIVNNGSALNSSRDESDLPHQLQTRLLPRLVA